MTDDVPLTFKELNEATEVLCNAFKTALIEGAKAAKRDKASADDHFDHVLSVVLAKTDVEHPELYISTLLENLTREARDAFWKEPRNGVPSQG